MPPSRTSEDRHSLQSKQPSSCQGSSKRESKRGSEARSHSSGSICAKGRLRTSDRSGPASTVSERRSRSSSGGGYAGSAQRSEKGSFYSAPQSGYQQSFASSRSQSSSCRENNSSGFAAQSFVQKRCFGVKMSGYREDQIVAGFSGFHGREDSFADNVGANARKNARSQVPDSAKYFLSCYLKRSGVNEGYAGAPSNVTDQAKFDLPGLHCAMGELRGKNARHPGVAAEKVPFPDPDPSALQPWRVVEMEPSIIAWN